MFEDLKSDAFVVSELFESTFNGLIGVYARCSTAERWSSEPQQDLIEKWNLRMLEIAKIKQNISKKDNWRNMYELTETLRPELKKMEQLEENNYFN
jgi:hypothetical protein